MISTDLADLTAIELLDHYGAGRASPVEAVEACLARIDRLNPRINAIATLLGEGAIAAARTSAERWARGEARPLEGVPYGLKDLIMTAGVRTAGGSRIYADHVPTVDAAVVERMQASGAVLLAKLHTFELARGDDSWSGPTRNPWDLSRTAGASSTGAGAALAARLMPSAIGTDTGGSIRVPATANGIAGLKPTFGRVSTFGVMPQSWTFDHVGPMARTAQDCALLLGVIAGHDPRVPTSIEAPVPDYAAAPEGVKGLRLGIPRDYFFDVIDEEMALATQRAVEALAEAGAEVHYVRLPNIHLSDVVGGVIILAEFAALHEVNVPRLEELGDRYTRSELIGSQFVSASDYVRAIRAIHLLQHDFETAFESADVLVVPGMVGVAPPVDTLEFIVNGEPRAWRDVVARMTLPFNLVGIPALAIPAGFSRDGLPLGIQIAARPLDEAACLRVGVAYEALTEHHRVRPTMLTDFPPDPPGWLD